MPPPPDNVENVPSEFLTVSVLPSYENIRTAPCYTTLFSKSVLGVVCTYCGRSVSRYYGVLMLSPPEDTE